MPLSKRDYQAMADIIANTVDVHGPEPAVILIAVSMAELFSQTNPLFQRGKFLTACKLPLLA